LCGFIGLIRCYDIVTSKEGEKRIKARTVTFEGVDRATVKPSETGVS
jgi:hypothetical protein